MASKIKTGIQAGKELIDLLSRKKKKADQTYLQNYRIAKKGKTGPPEAPFRGMSVNDLAKRFSTKQLKNIKDAFKRGELGAKEYQSQLDRINKAIGKLERRKVREQRESAGRPKEIDFEEMLKREGLGPVDVRDPRRSLRKGGLKKKKKSSKPKTKWLFGFKK